MKLFKRVLTAVLAGMMALAMLTGCSGAEDIVPGPNTPMPTDSNAKDAYYMLAYSCKQNGLKMPTYNEELSAIAEEYLDTYIANKVTKPAISTSETNTRNNATNAKLQTMTTLKVLSPTTGKPKMNTCAFQNLSVQGSERSTMQGAIVDGCNYVGIAVKEASGTKYMALVYVKAEPAAQ